MNDAGSVVRILLVDAEAAIHRDFREILARAEATPGERRDAGELFPDPIVPAEALRFSVATASHGESGLELLRAGNTAGQPFAIAFVAAGAQAWWGGVEITRQFWKESPDLQVVLCIESADHSWRETVRQLGVSDRLLILRKPFEEIEVLQLAHSLGRKWQLAGEVRAQVERLSARVAIRTGELERANTQLRAEVAERNAALEALRAAEERFSLAFRASPVAMLMESSVDERIVEINEAGLTLLARPRSEVLGRTAAELALWNDPGHYHEMRLLLRAGEPLHHASGLLRDGRDTLRKVQLWGERFTWRDAEHLLFIIDDVTELANLEEQLLQAQKMEVVGALAAGVAHEFNNVLTVIQGHLSLQLTGGSLSPVTRDSLETAFSASERAAGLIRRLLTSTRQQVIAREPLDLVDALTRTRALLDRTLGEQIVQRWELPATGPTIAGDAGAIEQLVLNLALNARDAMPEGGTLTLRLETHGETAQLWVSDTGAGIPAENLPRIFDPFFTTKPAGLSTGLGLAVVSAIVEKLDARIEVESTPGNGTTFRVDFPLLATTRLQEAAPSFPSAGGQRQTILIAEDEEMLLLLLQGILSASGYEVVTAPDGPTALRLWAERGRGIDLLLTDMVMPGGISGRVLAEKLRAQDPRLRIIYMSGYSPEFTGGDLELIPGVNFLPKPYTSRAVLEIVARKFSAAP